jgi:hypothetical protein
MRFGVGGLETGGRKLPPRAPAGKRLVVGEDCRGCQRQPVSSRLRRGGEGLKSSLLRPSAKPTASRATHPVRVHRGRRVREARSRAAQGLFSLPSTWRSSSGSRVLRQLPGGLKGELDASSEL